MIRIGIVGSDNSHAEAFSKLLNVGLDPADPQTRLLCPDGSAQSGSYVFPFSDFKVTAIFGTDPVRTEEVARIGNIPTIVQKPEDMIGAVDAVMVVWRHGGLHYQYALPFVNAGMPVWVDKPFTVDPAEAVKLIELADAKGSIIAGGSTVKYLPDILKCRDIVAAAGDSFKGGSMTYAVSMHNDYGNFFFYSAHLAECALRVFGKDAQSVYATFSDNGATALLNYPGRSVALHFVTDNYRYRVQLNIGTDTQYFDFDIPGTYFYGFTEFAAAIKAGKTLIDREELLAAVRLTDAIQKSAESGAPVKL